MTVDFSPVRHSVQPLFQSVAILPVSSLILSYLSSPGGPVRQVGVTITMDDVVMNGTNRVVLDGVMTEKECDRILQLATVSPDC